jgi:hypothetical protein
MNNTEKKIRDQENELLLLNGVLEQVIAATEGKACDFGESFLPVRKVADLWREKHNLEVCLEDCQFKISSLKAYLYNLIGAISWYNECLDARDWASWMKAVYREDYLLYKRWDKSLCHATKLFNAAREAYHDILENLIESEYLMSLKE